MGFDRPPDPGGQVFPRLGLEEKRRGKFLLVESKDENMPLSKVKIGIMTKFLQHHVPGYVDVNLTKDGKMVVLAAERTDARKVVGEWDVGWNGLKVNISLHTTLNSVKGTFYSNILQDDDIEEMMPELKKQDISKIERMKRWKNGKLEDSPVFLVTFDTPKLPKEVKIGYLKCSVRIYYPRPLRCGSCLSYGKHTTKRCSSSTKYCKTCSNPLPHQECGPMKCKNCSKPHDAFNKECEVYQDQLMVMRIKTDRNISFVKAKIEYDKLKRSATPTQSYSQILTSNNEMAAANNQRTNTNMIEHMISTQCSDMGVQTIPLAESSGSADQKLRDDVNKLMTVVQELRQQNIVQGKKIEALEHLLIQKDSIIAEKNAEISNLNKRLRSRKKGENKTPCKDDDDDNDDDDADMKNASNDSLDQIARKKLKVILTDLSIGNLDEDVREKYEQAKQAIDDGTGNKCVTYDPTTGDVLVQDAVAMETGDMPPLSPKV